MEEGKAAASGPVWLSVWELPGAGVGLTWEPTERRERVM